MTNLVRGTRSILQLARWSIGVTVDVLTLAGEIRSWYRYAKWQEEALREMRDEGNAGTR